MGIRRIPEHSSQDEHSEWNEGAVCEEGHVRLCPRAWAESSTYVRLLTNGLESHGERQIETVRWTTRGDSWASRRRSVITLTSSSCAQLDGRPGGTGGIGRDGKQVLDPRKAEQLARRRTRFEESIQSHFALVQIGRRMACAAHAAHAIGFELDSKASGESALACGTVILLLAAASPRLPATMEPWRKFWMARRLPPRSSAK
jgi:hypothetical protein